MFFVKSKQDVRVNIRYAISRDLPEVLAIEKESSEFPWSKEDFVRCFRCLNCVGIVSEYDDRVVGFMLFASSKTLIHILNLAVDPDYRHLGIGRQMVCRLIKRLSSQRLIITSIVSAKNLLAQLFFRTNGFRVTSFLRKFYKNPVQDACLMQYKLLG